MINFYDAAVCFTVIVYQGASTRNFLVLEIIRGERRAWKCKEYLDPTDLDKNSKWRF